MTAGSGELLLCIYQIPFGTVHHFLCILYIAAYVVVVASSGSGRNSHKTGENRQTEPKLGEEGREGKRKVGFGSQMQELHQDL